METKICSTCELELTLDNFEKRSPSGSFRAQCKNCVSNRKHNYYLNNQNNIIAKAKNYYMADPKKCHQNSARWAKKNPKKVKITKKKWKKNNPDKAKSAKARRRANENSVEYSNFTRKDIILLYGDKCFYCQDGKFEHVDHYIPISKKGPHILENVRPSCAFCNLSKSSTMPDIWIAKRKKM